MGPRPQSCQGLCAVDLMGVGQAGLQSLALSSCVLQMRNDFWKGVKGVEPIWDGP